MITYKQLTFELSQVLSQLNESSIESDKTVQLCITLNNTLQVLTQFDTRTTCDNEIQRHCGPRLWWQEAYLNMSDPSWQCPSAWREYNTSGVRACGRPIGSIKCAATTYFTGYQYSRICGRSIGYQVASPDSFNTDDEVGLDGISITYIYGTQRNHVWSYVADLSQMRNSSSDCPCSSQLAEMPPQFVGDNYYCESGNPSIT